MDDATAKQLAELRRKEAELADLEGENARIAAAGYSEHSNLYQRKIGGVRKKISELSGVDKEGKKPSRTPDNGVNPNDPRFERPAYRNQ